MKNWLATMMCGGLLLAGGVAFGDDMPKEHMAKHDQMMKDCMARQDSSMGKDAAMKACNDVLKKDAMSKDKMDKEPMQK